MNALSLSVLLATSTVVVLLIFGVPFAWWLTRTQSRFKPFLKSIIILPLVLPPTVLGFYLLILLSPVGWIGQLIASMGIDPLVFNFKGLLIASIIYSLPFMIQPLYGAFSAVPKAQLEAAQTLGYSTFNQFRFIVLPQSKVGLMQAVIFTFAHTIGEFGVILMIGGNIPNETQVLSIVIFEAVETLDYAKAHTYSAGLLIMSFTVLSLMYFFDHKIQIIR